MEPEKSYRPFSVKYNKPDKTVSEILDTLHLVWHGAITAQILGILNEARYVGLLPKEGNINILYLGGGHGDNVERLLISDPRVTITVVEGDEKKVQYLKELEKRHPGRVKVIHGFYPDTLRQLQSESYHMIVQPAAGFYGKKEDAQKLFEEAYRLLRKGGILYFDNPVNYIGYHEKVKELEQSGAAVPGAVLHETSHPIELGKRIIFEHVKIIYLGDNHTVLVKRVTDKNGNLLGEKKIVFYTPPIEGYKKEIRRAGFIEVIHTGRYDFHGEMSQDIANRVVFIAVKGGERERELFNSMELFVSDLAKKIKQWYGEK